MKNIINKNLKFFSLMAFTFTLFFVGCEREISDDAVLATYSNTADIFTDAPIGLTDAFFESFDPASGANPFGFGVDNNVAYVGRSSIRIDVPAPNDPEGGYIGGIFRDRGVGRNLTGFDALTFWAKASTTASFGTVGFGVDFEESKYETSVSNLQLSTGWKKYVIPIPDPSKLNKERGLFIFAAGTESTNGQGYTIWIDELRFEKLGNNNLLYPYMLDGQDLTVSGFIGSNQVLGNLGAVFNLSNGQNISVNAAPSYFNFNSSNPAVTSPFELNNFGQMTTQIIGSSGTALVTAQLGNDLAQGSLTINAAGEFPHAPVPTRNQATVISLFSDAYNNVPVRHYNGFFQGSNTQGGAGNDPNNVDIQAPFLNGTIDNIIHYTQLDFVSIGMYETVPTVNISGMTHLHVDINVRQAVTAGNFIRIELHSSLANGPTTSSGSFVINAATLTNVDSNGWASIDIPISSFPGFNDATNLGQLFFVSGNPGGIFNIWVDNVYFYAQ
ncbi:carbohydrate-binding protein [Flavobacterium orientale]|uniref:Carbohydrate-binding protein n=1 Tax=Flavobacterium orientale TaxID=1756020 RepID=A0A916Y386_9FLAO|nr:carbohydrate-binding protein [Flavobacterium orientale]GGD29379.1 hypothetical protein GCM10011343_19430 [Flavobacterium orientale]